MGTLSGFLSLSAKSQRIRQAGSQSLGLAALVFGLETRVSNLPSWVLVLAVGGCCVCSPNCFVTSAAADRLLTSLRLNLLCRSKTSSSSGPAQMRVHLQHDHLIPHLTPCLLPLLASPRVHNMLLFLIGAPPRCPRRQTLSRLLLDHDTTALSCPSLRQVAVLLAPLLSSPC